MSFFARKISKMPDPDRNRRPAESRLEQAQANRDWAEAEKLKAEKREIERRLTWRGQVPVIVSSAIAGMGAFLAIYKFAIEDAVGIGALTEGERLALRQLIDETGEKRKTELTESNRRLAELRELVVSEVENSLTVQRNAEADPEKTSPADVEEAMLAAREAALEATEEVADSIEGSIWMVNRDWWWGDMVFELMEDGSLSNRATTGRGARGFDYSKYSWSTSIDELIVQDSGSPDWFMKIKLNEGDSYPVSDTGGKRIKAEYATRLR